MPIYMHKSKISNFREEYASLDATEQTEKQKEKQINQDIDRITFASSKHRPEEFKQLLGAKKGRYDQGDGIAGVFAARLNPYIKNKEAAAR